MIFTVSIMDHMSPALVILKAGFRSYVSSVRRADREDLLGHIPSLCLHKGIMACSSPSRRNGILTR